MKLTEIVNYLFVHNGQYITGGLESIGLTKAQIWLDLKPVLENYQKYMPLTRQFNISINKSFDFTDHEFGVPERISEVIPVSNGNSSSSLPFASMLNQMDAANPFKTVFPRRAIHRYRKPILYFDEPCSADICAHYNYRITETKVSDALTEVEIFDIEWNQILLDLFSAEFLKIVGRQRRAFVYTDLAITTDAETLAKEGMELEKDALSRLYDKHEWWTGLHV